MEEGGGVLLTQNNIFSIFQYMKRITFNVSVSQLKTIMEGDNGRKQYSEKVEVVTKTIDDE